MEKQRNGRKNFNKKPNDRFRNNKSNSQYGEKKSFEKQNHNVPNKHIVPENNFTIKEMDAKVLCSFIVLPNCNPTSTLESLTYTVENAHITTVFIHTSNQDIQQQILQKFTKYDISCFTYTDESEERLHNKVFDAHPSDIFIKMNSNILLRPYSLNILIKYLHRNNTIATVPLVYNTSFEIQKYSCRFPSLISKIKTLFGCKNTIERLQMMDKGLSTYYKVHKIDYSLSQIVVFNSKALLSVGKFCELTDSTISIITLYKKLAKCGGIVFLPMARCIELNTTLYKKDLVSIFVYYLKYLI